MGDNVKLYAGCTIVLRLVRCCILRAYFGIFRKNVQNLHNKMSYFGFFARVWKKPLTKGLKSDIMSLLPIIGRIG